MIKDMRDGNKMKIGNDDNGEMMNRTLFVSCGILAQLSDPTILNPISSMQVHFVENNCFQFHSLNFIVHAKYASYTYIGCLKDITE